MKECISSIHRLTQVHGANYSAEESLPLSLFKDLRWRPGELPHLYDYKFYFSLVRSVEQSNIIFELHIANDSLLNVI